MGILTRLGKAFGKKDKEPEPQETEAPEEPFSSDSVETAEPPKAAAEVATNGDPAEGDRQILLVLQQQGADLSLPRHARFYLYFPTEQGARTAQQALAEHPISDAHEYRVTVEKSASDENWLCLVELNLLVCEESIEQLRLDFGSLASYLGGEYDGWEAAVKAA